EVVTREQLQGRLWPADTFVDFESCLNTAANRLRIALGDSADVPRYIETLPRIGYRFIAPVREIPIAVSMPVLVRGGAGAPLEIPVEHHADEPPPVPVAETNG